MLYSNHYNQYSRLQEVVKGLEVAMFNHHFLQKYARLRHDEFLAEANRARLVRIITGERPSLGQRVRWQMGDWLIALGCKLKAQPPLVLERKNGF